MRTLAWLEQARQDLRFGARNLAASPGFTAMAVTSLALGIMATTAMYSVVHAVVLDPFPYKDVHQLTSVRVSEAGSAGGALSNSATRCRSSSGTGGVCARTVRSAARVSR